MVVTFAAQFEGIARALDRQGLFDADDAFFYDRLVSPSGEIAQVRVQTISGLLPVLPAVAVPMRYVRRVLALGKRFERMRDAYRETGGRGFGHVPHTRWRGGGAHLGDRAGAAPGHAQGVLRRGRAPLTARAPERLEAIREQPVRARRGSRRLDRLRARRVDDDDVRRQLELARPGLAAGQLGDNFKLEYPTGSGQQRTFGEIAQDLADRIVAIWLPGPDGRRPLYGGVEKLQTDPAWKDNLLFNEYFHGDNGAGLGAAHQTGWTALVVDLILAPPSAGRERERMERRELLSRAGDLGADAGAACRRALDVEASVRAPPVGRPARAGPFPAQGQRRRRRRRRP